MDCFLELVGVCRARRHRGDFAYHNMGRIPSPAERDQGNEGSEFSADNLLTKLPTQAVFRRSLIFLLLFKFSRSYSKLELLDGARG